MILNNICKQCAGQCCKHELIYLFDEEYEKIKPFLKHKLKKDKINKVLWILTSGKQSCQCLGINGCIVPYENKPEICKLYPFLPDYTKSLALGNLIIEIDPKCPYHESFEKSVIGHTISKNGQFIINNDINIVSSTLFTYMLQNIAKYVNKNIDKNNASVRI